MKWQEKGRGLSRYVFSFHGTLRKSIAHGQSSFPVPVDLGWVFHVHPYKGGSKKQGRLQDFRERFLRTKK